ncbi:RND transporter [Cypionkella aquatica]|uniref:RND transporter n=1 Tax=Cypionkella aquatica TaxID=1756042 RepID=A0AA37TZX7_9RHOB|nr:efflux RND transporter periplasmic adaptor subunit [Cypionkella aquatica]GLS85966.1 RND transporter [Cypionkella aquatica]
MFMAGQGLAQTPPGGKPAGPAAVGTVTIETQDVPYIRTLPGRAVAFETGEIRARVSGVVEEILYAAGDKLEPGDPMFKIEDDSYTAAFASAKAAVAGAEVQVQTTRATVDRYKTLQGNAVSKADLQSAEAAAASAVASLAAAQAALDVAQLDLDRTTVRSPIAGIAGIATVSLGALVTANQADALATVTRLDPIYIDVSDSSAGMLRVRAQIDDGSLKLGTKVGVALVLENGETYDGEGTVVVLGNVVSATTGTFDLRVQFDNPKRLILPGQFLRVKMTLGSTRAKLVPQRATGRNSDGTLTVFVAKDGVAKKVALTSSGSQDNAWIITAGIEDGDLVIVDGLTNLRDGAAVKPVPVTIDADGVVHDAVVDTAVAPDATKPTTGNN